MRILVTGGAGFIGSHLVLSLSHDGHNIVILDDFSTASVSTEPYIRTDIADLASIPQMVSTDPDVIVHAAAQASVPRSMADPMRDRAVNVVGTEHVIAAARLLGRCRVVFLSTGGAIYGDTIAPATELTTPRPLSYYGAHKYLAERYLEYSGVPYAIARLANVYGPGQRSDLEGGVAAIFAERLAAHKDIVIFGDGEQRRDFIHVQDVVGAISALITTEKCGLWNVGTGTETTVNFLLERLQAHIEPADAILHKPAREGDVRRSCLCIKKISDDLGWHPHYSLDHGLATLTPQKVGD